MRIVSGDSSGGGFFFYPIHRVVVKAVHIATGVRGRGISVPSQVIGLRVGRKMLGPFDPLSLLPPIPLKVIWMKGGPGPRSGV